MKRSHLLSVLFVVASAHLFGAYDGQSADGHHALMVPAQYRTIQAAVNAAEPGDVIYVTPGTYCEQVLITKSDLTVRQRDDVNGARAVVSGACAGGGAGSAGFKVAGTSTNPVVNVEIGGFVVEAFETGILLQNVVRSRVIANEVRDNTASPTPPTQNGIMLVGSSFNEISRNFVHGNGHMGIAVRLASNGNIVRDNRLVDNQVTNFPACSLMVYGNSVGNQIVNNEVIDSVGAGVMIGPAGVQTQTLVAGNRIHGHEYAGIVIQVNSQANLVVDNDARDNNTSGLEPDLMDYNAPGKNLWLRNLGGCAAGNAAC